MEPNVHEETKSQVIVTFRLSPKASGMGKTAHSSTHTKKFMT